MSGGYVQADPPRVPHVPGAPSPGTARHGEHGVALMLVLWLIVVLGFMAAGVTTVVRAESEVIVATRARTVARYAAESGVEAAIAETKRLLVEARTATEQARVFAELDDRLAALREVELGDARFRVTVTDLNARIDLNASDPAVLRTFLTQFVGEPEAELLVDALEDWKDADNEPRPGGAEADAYLRAGSPFHPPNRSLTRLDDLTRIRGFADSLTYAIAPYVTVIGTGRVNVNTAPRPVLLAIPGIGPDEAGRLIARRERGEPFASLLAARNFFSARGSGLQISRLTTLPDRILIVSRGWQGGQPLTHEIQAVFEIEGLQLADGPRLRVRHWTERDL